MLVTGIPLKINMKPTNHPTKEEHHIPNLHIRVPCYIVFQDFWLRSFFQIRNQKWHSLKCSSMTWPSPHTTWNKKTRKLVDKDSQILFESRTPSQNKGQGSSPDDRTTKKMFLIMWKYGGGSSYFQQLNISGLPKLSVITGCTCWVLKNSWHAVMPGAKVPNRATSILSVPLRSGFQVACKMPSAGIWKPTCKSGQPGLVDGLVDKILWL